MKSLRVKFPLLAAGLVLLMVLAGCEKDDPAVIFDPDEQGAPAPEIVSVDPSNAAVAGVTRIRIVGRNFSPVAEENTVYFNLSLGTVVSATGTELSVVPPLLIADGVRIRVVVRRAFLPAEYDQPYRLQTVSSSYGTFGSLNSITVDAQENLYVSPPSRVVRMTPDGQLTDFGTLSFPTASAMKFGPGGYLYAQRNNNRNLYRLAPGGGADELFVRFPVGITVSFFDFDQNGNLYAGGEEDGLYVLNPNLTTRAAGQYQSFDVRSVRVFEGYVYVGSAGANAGIWRNQILSADGSLGNNELYFDWPPSAEYDTTGIADLTFAEDGDLYIAASGKSTNPIVVIHPNKSSELLYEGALLYPAESFVWGTDEFLYVNHGTSAGVSRISMGKRSAPYYGRQ